MKIVNIAINKYKAFKNLETISVGGSNVFIYGENGSGKSSFYYALKDFFQSSVENVDMASLRNYSLTDGGTDCYIEVEFEGGGKNILNETIKNTDTPQIKDANRLKSFLTYKHLLGVHNVKISDQIDVFELVVNGVLKHFKSSSITGSFELGELYKNALVESKKIIGRQKDFNFTRQKVVSVTEKANLFNNALKKLFEKPEAGELKPDYLGPQVNFFLQKLYPNLKIDFKRQLLQVDNKGNISGGKILLEMNQDGVSIDNNSPHFSLNEAKLSAIAISIFLGAIKRQSIYSKDIKPLFLDDILIGLDNENRMKLLHILQEIDVPETDKVFKDFQIFITTYDRHWYEVAKINLADWKFIEFYKSEKGPQIINNDKTPLEKARCYYETFDFPACATTLRKVGEQALKNKLPLTHTIGEGLKALIKPPSLDELIINLKKYYTELGVEPPIVLIESLQNYKSIILNPLSHSDIESPIYKNDLDLAFKTIQDLENLVLPTRDVLIEKGSVFNIDLPAINYTAVIEMATNVFLVEDNSSKSISDISFYFRKWTREGIEFASPTGNPVKAISNLQRLEQIKSNPYSLSKAVQGLNMTYTDQGMASIDEQELKSSIVIAGENLLEIISRSKN